jgi:hypothetical protein
LYPAVTKRGEGVGGENRCGGGCRGRISFTTVHAMTNQIKQPKQITNPSPPPSPPYPTSRKRYKTVLTFPIAVRDLGLDAQLRVRYRVPSSMFGDFNDNLSSDDDEFRVSYVKIWDSQGRIKQGEYNVEGSERVETSKEDLAEELRENDYWLDGITRERFKDVTMEGGMEGLEQGENI